MRLESDAFLRCETDGRKPRTHIGLNIILPHCRTEKLGISAGAGFIWLHAWDDPGEADSPKLFVFDIGRMIKGKPEVSKSTIFKEQIVRLSQEMGGTLTVNFYKYTRRYPRWWPLRWRSIEI